MHNSQSSLKKIGALWKKKGKKGEFMSGVVNDAPIFVFANSGKKDDRHPDYEVFLKIPDENTTELGEIDARNSPF